jgi:hypothetical protein
MITKREFFLFLLCFIAGAVATWQGWRYVYAINNTQEKVAQRIVNQSIQDDLCLRIEGDLERFKEAPGTFRRTSLRIIELETRQFLRKTLIAEGIPSDFPIEYKGNDSNFGKCLDEAKKWLYIPSAGQEDLADELARVDPRQSSEAITQATTVPGASTGLKNRIALVIGNYDYRNRPLKNPKADAEDMKDFLQTADFDVIYLGNGRLKDMRSHVEEFISRLRHSDVGLIYYSGHGVEYRGRNYLLPVDTNIQEEGEIPRQAIDISAVVDSLNKLERKVNIVIIDACRSNFIPSSVRSASIGLRKMDGVRGTILAFSTAPGQVAEDGNDRNSPYTKHLLRSMAVPGRKIEDVFKETARQVEVETVGRQVPWYNSSLLVDFSLK